jgi:hypothetical protein
VIKDLDLSLKAFIQGEATPGSELSKAFLSVGSPTANWQKSTAPISGGLAVNLYLYRTLENTELRSNEPRILRNPDGTTSFQQAPHRIECSYLVTAWNFANNPGGPEPEQLEHRVLSQIFFVLLRNPTMPRKYLTGSLATQAAIGEGATAQEIDLPIVSARSDDLGGADSDFWTSMGAFLRPSINCKLTLAMDLSQAVSASMATTVQSNLVIGDQLTMIGGTVRDPGSNPIPNAWVVVDNQQTLLVTDANGQFLIDRITTGPHLLTVRAVGFQDATRAISVPQPTGEYDITLTPLP